MPIIDSETVAAKELVANHVSAIEKDLADQNGDPMREMGVWLTDILLDNERSTVHVENCGYDFSSYGRRTSEPFDLSLYRTVGDFLDNESTGNTVATYCSGSGFAAEMYSETANIIATELFVDLIKRNYPELLTAEGCLEDPILGELIAAGCCEWKLLEAFNAIPLMDCYTLYLPDAMRMRKERNNLAQMQLERDLRQASFRKELAGDIPVLIQEATDGIKYEKANWQALIMLLEGFSKQYGKDKVGAALTLCRLHLSNSVASELSFRFPVPVMVLSNENI